MSSKTKLISVILDIIIVILIVAFGIAIRMPSVNSLGSAQLNNELIDEECYYLSDPDSYLYARIARKYSQDLSGFTFVNVRTDDYVMSPVSSRENGLVCNGLPLIAALSYRFLHLFCDITIEQIIYYINAVLCSLAAVFAYIYVRRQTNVFGGVISAILIVVMTPFLEHSVAGYFDTDVMLCAVPMCLMCCYALMIASDKLRSKIVYAILALVSFFVLAITWETCYIYLGLIVILSVITTVQLALVRGSGNRLTGRALIREIVFMAADIIAMILISILIYGRTMIDSIRRLFTNMLAVNDYPSPTKYILELGNIPLLDNGLEGAFLTTGSGIINNLGGVIVLAMALIAIILLIVLRRRESIKFFACNMSFVVSWFFITLPFLIVGTRFLQLVCLPLSLLVGLAIGMTTHITIGSLKSGVGYILSVFLAIIVLFGPLAGTFVASNIPAPFYNKTYDGACTWINNYASENADIMTWWDYGYFIEYASARHVLADGGTFDGRYFYMLAHALLTDDPHLSVAIFDMLNFSGVDSVDVAEKYIVQPELVMEALIDILPVSKEQAEVILMTKYKLTREAASDIVGVAKPDITDERYLIISRDMITKIKALSYYGMYDFHSESIDVALGVSSSPAVATPLEEKVEIRGIDNLYAVIKKTDDNDYVTLVDNSDNPIDISRIIYVEDGVRIRDEEKLDAGYTLYCINDSGEYSFIVCSDNIADSMLVSLMAISANDVYTRVYEGVLGDNLSSSESVSSRFFGDLSTPDNAGAYVYKVRSSY